MGTFFSVEGESTGLARTDLWSGRDTYIYTDVQGVDRMRLTVDLLFRGGKGNVKDSEKIYLFRSITWQSDS